MAVHTPLTVANSALRRRLTFQVSFFFFVILQLTSFRAQQRQSLTAKNTTWELEDEDQHLEAGVAGEEDEVVEENPSASLDQAGASKQAD